MAGEPAILVGLMVANVDGRLALRGLLRVKPFWRSVGLVGVGMQYIQGADGRTARLTVAPSARLKCPHVAARD